MRGNIAGISAHYHDAACCVLRDGQLVAAAQEERFSRLKHDPSIPKRAFEYCLREAGLTLPELDRIAYYEDPQAKLERQLWMRTQGFPLAVSRPLRPGSAARPMRDIQRLLGYEGPIELVGHHESHAAGAFFYSGFDEAAILTVDGVGEWTTLMFAHGQKETIRVLGTVDFPHSIGLLYSTITAYLGFEVNDGEYKVMGLAPYGGPHYVDQLWRMIRRHRGPDFELDMDYFAFLNQEIMYSPKLTDLLGQPPRPPESELTPFAQDLARSLQVVLEDLLLEKAAWLHEQTGSQNLCLSGGVALNCVANARIRRDGPFRRLFVQPAASDAGSALGAAAVAHIRLTGERPPAEALQHVFLGPAYSSAEIARLLAAGPARFQDFRGDEEALLVSVAQRLEQGEAVGWFQGRMEFGPRALGARSILADPRRPEMREHINALVKKREAFRPFAPSVLESEAAKHFDLDEAAPFMLETCPVRSPLALPAVTHVDGSARVQTVSLGQNGRFARLLQAFGRRTGCPILLNTSFNLRGEPIVCTPTDAVLCFIRSDLDALVLEDFVLDRAGLPASWLRWHRRTAPLSPEGVHNAVYTFL